MKTFLLAVLLAVPALPATYHVNATTGSDANTSVQAQNPATPWATISHCSSVAVALDTCLVHAGTYSAWTQTTSGTPGNPITFTTNSGDVVTITGTLHISNTDYIVIGAPAGGGGCAANAATHSFPKAGSVPVGGCFTFNNAGIVGGGSGTPTTHLTLTYNSFSGSSPPTALNIPDGFGSGSTDNVIGHNFFNGLSAPTPYCTHSWYIYGDRNRIEYNESEGLGDDFSDLGGANVVFRFNYWHDDDGNRSIGCGQSPTHQDLVQVIGGGTSPTLSFSLLEGNTTQNITNDGGNTHAFSIIRTGSSTPPAADTIIIRYNYANNYDGDAVNVGGVGDNVPNNSTYNNTAATKQSLAVYNSSFLSLQGTIGGAAILNNIIYNVEATAGGPCPCYPISAGSLIENGNLLFTTGFSGSWPSPYSAEGTYAALHNVNPLFANFPTDGSLQATSPAIGAGVALTTAVGAGSTSTSLTVANCHLFQPGWAGIPGDWIRIGSSTTVQISTINYSTCVMGLASAASWSNGDSIFLQKLTDGTAVLKATATAPDVGAFPVVFSGAQLSTAPTSINFGNQQTGTTSAASTVTVSNPGSTATGSVSCSITGTNANQFSFTGTCSGTLAAGASFPISVFCSPTTTGLKSANFTVTDTNLLTASTTLSCTGTTTAPVLVNAPTSIAYGNQPTGTTSAAQAIVVTNSGTGSAAGVTCTLTTGTQYAITDPGNCPTSLSNVPGSNTFTIHITFTPTTTGLKNDTLTVAATGGVTATTTLSGTGITTAPAFSLTPASVACGSSNLGVLVSCPALTLTNTGSASGTVSTIAFGANASSYSYTATAPCNSLPATLTAGQSCTITPKLIPALAGALNTALTVTDTPDSLTASSTVTGTGINPNAPTLINFTACASGTTPVSCTIPSTTSGNLVVVGTATSFGCSPGTPAIADGGDTFVEANIGGTAALATDTGVNHQSDLLYALTAGGKTTVTMTTTPACLADLVVWEWHGVTTLTNVAVLNTQAATTSPAGASVTLSQSSQVSLSIAIASHPITGLFAGNAWTNDSLAFSVGWAHLINASTGLTNAQWTTGSSSTYASSTASFGPTPPVVNTPGGVSISGALINGILSH